MSGAGKTYWSKKLAEIGFTRYCCDDLIEKSLGTILKKQGYQGIQDVAKWMGQPYDSQHQQTSNIYIREETKVMQKLLSNGVKKPNVRNIVIDTTGSAIYTDNHVLDFISSKTIIVYLETPQSVQEQMFQVYLTDPKPVIWGNVFKKKKNETDRQALARCYPILLQTRSKKYKKLAHRTLDYHRLRASDYKTEDFLKEVTQTA